MTMQTTWRAIVISLATVLSAVTIPAQEEENHADHEALRQMRDMFEEAAAKNDLDRMKPFLAPDFTIVTFTDREFLDFEAFKAQWQKTRLSMLGEGGSYRVQLNPEHSVLMGDIALCRGNASNVLVNGKGDTFTFTGHWSVVCQKIDGQWKIVRGHNSLDPFHNPMREHAVKGLVIKYCAGAFAAGVLLAAIAIALTHRKRTDKRPI